MTDIVKELRDPTLTAYATLRRLAAEEIERLRETNNRSSEQAGDMVDKAVAWDACIKARKDERERRIKAEQDCEHWAKNYDEQGQSLIKWMDRALASEARLREYEKLGTAENIREFLTNLSEGRATIRHDVSEAKEGGQ